MPDYLHRTTKRYLKSVSPTDLPGSVDNYIRMPDLSLAGNNPLYWKIDGDVVSEMSQSEKDVVDAAILSSARDDAIDEHIEQSESVMRQLAQMLLRENNILREQFNTTTAEVAQLTNTNFAPRTIEQLKAQLRSDMGT